MTNNFITNKDLFKLLIDRGFLVYKDGKMIVTKRMYEEFENPLKYTVLELMNIAAEESITQEKYPNLFNLFENAKVPSECLKYSKEAEKYLIDIIKNIKNGYRLINIYTELYYSKYRRKLAKFKTLDEVVMDFKHSDHESVEDLEIQLRRSFLYNS